MLLISNTIRSPSPILVRWLMKPALSNKTIPHPSTWSAMNNGPWVLES
ncbi:SAM-dependent methyltransferase, partial [Vibrio antiquarius]